jgi:hypothetical protein
MADIKITKAAAKPTVSALSSATGKARPSAFDVIQSKIAGKVAADMKLPPLAQAPPQKIASMETALQKNLEKTDARSAADVLRPELKDGKAALEKVTSAVNKLPQQSAFNPLRERLNVIEQQYQRSSTLVNGMKSMDPKSLLRAQVQLYEVSENLELLSKVVDHVSSGVKTIMQTQV